MARGRIGMVVGMVLGLLVLASPGIAFSSPVLRAPLSEDQMKDALAAALPNVKFDYEEVDYTGTGAVIAGKATQGERLSYFRARSGRASFEGRHIPSEIFAPIGNYRGLQVRMAQGQKGPGPKISISLSVSIEDALCTAQLGEEACSGV